MFPPADTTCSCTETDEYQNKYREALLALRLGDGLVWLRGVLWGGYLESEHVQDTLFSKGRRHLAAFKAVLRVKIAYSGFCL